MLGIYSMSGSLARKKTAINQDVYSSILTIALNYNHYGKHIST